MRRDSLLIETASGQEHSFNVEVAQTNEDKALGLMFRRSLPEGHGMLFPYGPQREITMWMKNTYISLDMVFIRADGRIHRIEERAEPLSQRIISSRGAVSAVLEIGGGEARRLGIKPGDEVRHAIFGRAGQ